MTDERPEDTEADLGPIFETTRWIAELLAEDVPELIEVQSDLVAALRPLTYAVHEGAARDEPIQLARSRIVNQANNDFVDVFGEAMSGRGRSAVRTARTLFEHAVNHRWISADASEAQRYLDQAAIARKLDLDLDTADETEFNGKFRLRFRHWKRKLTRDVETEHQRVLDAYGPAFRSRWTTTNLHDRSVRVGLDGDYDNYRLLSTVIHGSAGGDLGLRNEDIHPSPIVRTGPNLAQSPLALKLGTRYYSILIEDLGKAVGGDATVRLERLLTSVETHLPAHRRACHSIDATIWPSDPVHSMLYLKVTVAGEWVWLLLDPERGMTITATPTLPASQIARLTELVAQIEDANPRRTKPVFIGVEGRATPRPDGTWRRASDTLRPRALDESGHRWLKIDHPMFDPSLYD